MRIAYTGWLSVKHEITYFLTPLHVICLRACNTIWGKSGPVSGFLLMYI